MVRSRRVLMLAFPDCQVLDVVGPMQIFAGANSEPGPPRYELVVAAPERGPFRTSSGMSLVADLAFADLNTSAFRATDTVIAPGGDPPGFAPLWPAAPSPR